MSFRRQALSILAVSLCWLTLSWGASPVPVPAPGVHGGLPKGLFSPFPAPPTNIRLSSGLSVDGSGNLLINASMAGGGTSLSNGLSLDSSGNLYVNCVAGCSGGGSTSPGGSTTQLQWNSAGAFGGISGWTTNGSTTISGGASSVLDLHSATSFFLPGALSTGLVKVTTATGAVSTASAGTDYVAPATTVNGHALNTNVIVSASDLTTGTLPHAQLPALVSGDIPNNAANTSGSAASFTGNLVGDVTGTQGATAVGKINGGTVPASATVLGSNSSSQPIAATVQGNGAKVQLSTGTTTTNDCAKFDANGNVIDAGAVCGSGSVPSGTQGQPLINSSTSSGTSYATSNLYVDASQFAGATADLKIAAALATAPTNSSITIDARALGGAGVTFAANPLATTVTTGLSCPVSGTLLLPASVITVNAPIVNPCFKIVGAGHYFGNGTTKQNGTILVAGSSLLPAYFPAGTVQVNASTGGTGTTSYTFTVTNNTLASGALGTNVQVGDIFVKCNTAGNTGGKCAGAAAATTVARGVVTAVSANQLTIESTSAVAADNGGSAGGVNFVTYPVVLLMGDVSGASGSPAPAPGIAASEMTIDCQLNSIAGCVPFATYNAQNLSQGFQLTLLPYDNAGWEVSGNSSQQFWLHDIWTVSGGNTTTQSFCGLNRMSASTTSAFARIACALTGGPSTYGILIDAPTKWQDQIHIIGVTNTGMTCGEAISVPYISYQAPGNCTGGSINDVDVSNSGTMTYGVKIGTNLPLTNYQVHRLNKMSGTVTNLFDDLNATCLITSAAEPQLADYKLDAAGNSRSTSAQTNCNTWTVLANNVSTGSGASTLASNAIGGDGQGSGGASSQLVPTASQAGWIYDSTQNDYFFTKNNSTAAVSPMGRALNGTGSKVQTTNMSNSTTSGGIVTTDANGNTVANTTLLSSIPVAPTGTGVLNVTSGTYNTPYATVGTGTKVPLETTLTGSGTIGVLATGPTITNLNAGQGVGTIALSANTTSTSGVGLNVQAGIASGAVTNLVEFNDTNTATAVSPLGYVNITCTNCGNPVTQWDDGTNPFMQINKPSSSTTNLQIGGGSTYKGSLNLLATNNNGIVLTGGNASPSAITTYNFPSLGSTGSLTPAALELAQTFTALKTFGANASIGSTAHGVLLSENTSAVVATAAGTSNQMLASGGASADPSYKSLADLTPTLYAAGGGTAQAQTVTLAPALTSLTAGAIARWLPTAANSAAAPTLAVNGLTATAITKCGAAALVANDLTTSAVAIAIYDGTQWELQNPQATGCGSGSGGGGNGSAAFGAASVALSTTNLYANVFGGNTSATAATAGQTIGAVAQAVSNLKVVLGTALGGSQTLTVTLYDVTAAASGGVFCTVAASGTACTDPTHSYSVPAGHLVAWQAVLSTSTLTSNLTIGATVGAASSFSGNTTVAASATTGLATCAVGNLVKADGSGNVSCGAAGIPINFWPGGALSNSATSYFGAAATTTTSPGKGSTVMFPQSGTLSNLSCGGTTAMTGTQTYALTVTHGTFVNNASALTFANTSLTCTLSVTGSNTTFCQDTTSGHAFTVAANDGVVISAAPTNTPTAQPINCSMIFTP